MEDNLANNEQKHVFISHATKDDGFVKKLRQSLENCKIPVWVDSRNLRGGSKLEPEIETAIRNAKHTLVVLSPNTVNSPWVRKEIKKSLEIEKDHPDGYKTIPILLPGIEPVALGNWFDEEPVALPINLEPGTLQNAMPDILAALGEQLPSDKEVPEINIKPVAELLLELKDPVIRTSKGESRACATACVSFDTKIEGQRKVESKRFDFKSPFGPIEFDEITWYLEEFYRWPVGVFKTRAEKTEKKLPDLGKALYESILNHPESHKAVNAWKACAKEYDLRFSVMVDQEPPTGATKKKKGETEKAATQLLSIPWELLHDKNAYLVQGAKPIGIKRRLPNREVMDVAIAKLPVRILLVSARPEDNCAEYIDHRASAIPLIAAVENLGTELVSLTTCSPATFPAMMEEIKKAHESENPYDVVHFDGHGVYDERTKLGTLVFEHPRDKDKLYNRRSVLINADRIGKKLNQYRIPLMFLEACQTAKTEERSTASVAVTLLEKGIASVIAMTHSVLVTTASKFVEGFYKEIAHGARIGKAVLDAQSALALDSYRGKIPGAGDLHLQDWFVPVLYQDETDSQLFTRIPTQSSEQYIKKTKTLSLGKISEEKEKMAHTFVGRSRELLAMERLFVKRKYASIRGQGGAGKTTIALELAHWLVRTERFQKAAFVCVENVTEVRAVIDEIGQQLVPEGAHYSVAEYKNNKEALQPIQRELNEYATIIVIDNLESILPGPSQKEETLDDTLIDEKLINELFGLYKSLLEPEKTRLLFTSRERLPAPFEENEINLGALSQTDAIDLVCDILKENGQEPPVSDRGNTPAEVEDLVNAVNCHARALVLITNEVAARGVLAATEDLNQLMADIHNKFPEDREKSLYASIELSLRRLPKDIKDKLKTLALFHGGVDLDVWAQLLNLEKPEEIQEIAALLINVGLAEDKGYGHLQVDPALPSYMLSQITEAEKEKMQVKWAETMVDLVYYLYSQRLKDARIAAHLTILELANLLALLEYIKDRYSPENVVDTASRIERLIADLHKPKAMQKVVQIREMASGNIKEWSNAAFEAESMKIQSFKAQRDLQAAFDTAQRLLQKSLDEGEYAYSGADYDIAMAYYSIGTVLNLAGSSEQAIDFLEQAMLRFGKLADAGNKSAEDMVSTTIGQKADCLINLGKLDEAVEAYEKALKIVEKNKNVRAIAINKGHLGIAYLRQKKYKEAIEAYEDKKNIVEKLGEFQMMSVTYHQMGMVYEQTDNFKEAEKAYRQALSISIKIKDKDGEASELGQLGNLYAINGHLEDAVTFLRQARDIYVVLEDLQKEGRQRNNLAGTLIKLKRYDEARDEIKRAIECMSNFGRAGSHWAQFGILYNLEISTGNTYAAEQAWEKAFTAYLGYRKDGGYGQTNSAQIVETFKNGIKQGDTPELEKLIVEHYSNMDLDPDDKLLFSKLKLVLDGNRDISLAMDSGLFFTDAAELHLLLEWLGTSNL